MATIRNFRFAVHVLTGPADYISESVSQGVTFGQSIDSSISYQTVAQTVVLTGTPTDEIDKIEPSVEQDLVLGQEIAVQTDGPGAEHTVVLGQTVNNPPIEKEEEHSIIFSHLGSSSTQQLNVASSVRFWDRASITEWLSSASNTVVLSGSATKIFISVDAIPESGEHNIRFGQHTAWSEILRSAQNGATFSDSVGWEYIWQQEQDFVLSDSGLMNRALPLSVASSLILSHAFLASLPSSECWYDPSIGGGSGTTMPSGIPRKLVRQSSMKLVFPAVADSESWTHMASLRNPEIGDRTKLQMDRIFRESRGGTLQTYRDDDWPTQETVGVAIRLLTDDDVSDFMDFVDATLGAEIGFLDWEGNAYRGIMLTTADPIVRTRDNIIDVTFELIVLGSLG
jgi:hypothetical protein